MTRETNIWRSIDWLTIGLYLLFCFIGWINIYGASYNFDSASIFDFSNRAGKQFVWIMSALVLGLVLILIDAKSYEFLAYGLYAFWLIVLIITPILAKDVKGSLSWLQFGPVSLQPAEFAKCFTALALAKYMGQYEYRVKSFKDLIVPMAIVLVPMFIIMVLQKETGSALVFAAFFLMFYREGMTGYILLFGVAAVYFFIVVIRLSVVALPLGVGTAGILVAMVSILLIECCFLLFKEKLKVATYILAGSAVLLYAIALVVNIWIKVNFVWFSTGVVAASAIYILVVALIYRKRNVFFLFLFVVISAAYCHSCDLVFNKVLQPHQRIRIEVLLGLKDDPSGAGYNVNQSKIAIGSGGIKGKGFLQGTQTKLNFVPEQATDFIFCTVGEEWGFIGTAGVLILYLIFILRLVHIAERQKDQFSQVYAYSVLSIFILHLTINVGMVIGLLPVIGIPLPFFSYGGSSLWGFTLLLFILIKLDAVRTEKM